MKSQRRRSRPALSIVQNNNTSQTSLPEHTRSTPSARFSMQNLSWSNVNLSIPEHRAIDAAVLSPPGEDREERHNVIVSRSTSTNREQPIQQTPTKRRNPFALFKSFSSEDTTPATKRTLLKDRPDDVAKRRSTVSLLLSTSKHDSARPSINTDNSMNYISEYAVCFDTSPIRADENTDPLIASPKALSPSERPRWASRGDSNEGMRSFFNLPSMLKKERKEQPRFTVEEVSAEPPAAVPRSRPHTRSKTAPEGLICEAVRRIEEQKQQQESYHQLQLLQQQQQQPLQARAKKRRSMGALLQTILLPNHYGTNASTHCVAI